MKEKLEMLSNIVNIRRTYLTQGTQLIGLQPYDDKEIIELFDVHIKDILQDLNFKPNITQEVYTINLGNSLDYLRNIGDTANKSYYNHDASPYIGPNAQIKY